MKILSLVISNTNSMIQFRDVAQKANPKVTEEINMRRPNL